MYWLTNKSLVFYRGRRTPRCAAALTCLFLALIFSACVPRNPVARGRLFPIDSLLSAQASRLTDAKASLSKQVTFGSKQEQIDLLPSDTTAWIKELEAFGVLDAINKPINRDRYKVSDTTDNKSNLRVRAFSTHDDLPVKVVRLYYHRVLASIRKIEANYVEHNGLYKTNRKLMMEFNDVNGTPMMTSYSIAGGQKMFLDDTVTYDIRGKVRLEIK